MEKTHSCLVIFLLYGEEEKLSNLYPGALKRAFRWHRNMGHKC